jgi:hypothetical protein
MPQWSRGEIAPETARARSLLWPAGLSVFPSGFERWTFGHYQVVKNLASPQVTGGRALAGTGLPPERSHGNHVI